MKRMAILLKEMALIMGNFTILATMMRRWMEIKREETAIPLPHKERKPVPHSSWEISPEVNLLPFLPSALPALYLPHQHNLVLMDFVALNLEMIP
jgi:hypothetical protein